MAWTKFEPKAKFVTLGLTAIAALFVFYSVLSQNGFAGFPFDDAWIHLTFARTLASTSRFAYGTLNHGTSGSTSPLFTFLEAILFLITSNEFVVSLIISISAFAAAGYFFYLLVREIISLPWFPLIAILFFLSSPSLLVISNWGMETGLVVALLLWATYAYRRERWSELAIALGLAIWARPDTLVLALALGIDFLIFRTGSNAVPTVKPILIFIGIVALYVGFNLWLSGTPLPNTYYAKLAYYKSGQTDFWSALWKLIAGGGKIIAFVLAVVGTVWSLARRERGNIAVILYPLGMILLYHWKLPYLFQDGRYLIPIMPFLLLLASIGAAHISSWLFRSKSAATAFGISLVLIGAISAATGLGDAVRQLAFEDAYIHNLQVTTAEWCAKNLPVDAVILTHDIGALGFYSQRRVVDLVGLADPDMIAYLDKPGAISAARKKGANYAALLDNWYEIPNENTVNVNSHPESETMRVYYFTDTSRFVGPKVLSIYRYFYDIFRGDDPSGFPEALKEATATDPGNALTYTIAGEIFLAMHRNSEAEKVFQEALQHFPNSERAKRGMMAAMQVKPSSQ